MTREQRRALMAQELNPDQEVIVADTDIPDPPARVATANGTAPAPSFDMTQMASVIAAAVAQAIVQAQQQSTHGLAEALQQQRQPKPETFLTGGYHEKSHFHPGGADVPRPVLATEYWFAVWDYEAQKAKTCYPIDPAQMRDDEIVAMNAIVPGVHEIVRNDGSRVQARVIRLTDAMGNAFRTLIAFDPAVLSSDAKNSLPPLVDLARQLAPAMVAA